MELWDKIERRLAGLLGGCALAIGAYQIFGRYVDPHLAITWGDETTVYLIVWAVFLASSQLVRTDGHVRPDLVLRILKPRQQRIVEIGNCLVALAFCAGLTWFGCRFARGTWSELRDGNFLSFDPSSDTAATGEGKQDGRKRAREGHTESPRTWLDCSPL